MNSNILDYIILALVFAVVIHIFIQTFGKCNRTEGMGAPFSAIYSEKPLDILPYGSESSYGQSTSNLFDNLSQSSRSEVSQPSVEQVQQQIQQQVRQPVEQPAPGSGFVNQNNYIQQFVASAGKVCSQEAQHDANDIQNHQNNFFSFGEQINQSTREEITAVDRINQMQTSRNNELLGCSGKKISDVFDSLAQNDCEAIKKCKNPKCVIPTTVDPMTQATMYTKQSANGKSFSRYDVQFETDNVNNGGKFYNDIEAYDNMYDSNLVM